MRLAIFGISLVLVSTAIVGCGQSGNLQLANSPDYDKRAKYLLYSNEDNKAVQTEKRVKEQIAIAVPDQSTPASQVSSN